MNWVVGQELLPIVKKAITPEQLHLYADASGDRNPIHLDEKFAKEAGFPSVIVHGMLPMAFMADALLANFPEKEFKVTKLRARFRKVTFPGNHLTCGGTVRKVSEDGKMLTVAIWAKDEAGEVKTDGEAELALK
jgi:acyl dehydratase